MDDAPVTWTSTLLSPWRSRLYRFTITSTFASANIQRCRWVWAKLTKPSTVDCTPWPNSVNTPGHGLKYRETVLGRRLPPLNCFWVLGAQGGKKKPSIKGHNQHSLLSVGCTVKESSLNNECNCVPVFLVPRYQTEMMKSFANSRLVLLVSPHYEELDCIAKNIRRYRTLPALMGNMWVKNICFLVFYCFNNSLPYHSRVCSLYPSKAKVYSRHFPDFLSTTHTP